MAHRPALVLSRLVVIAAFALGACAAGAEQVVDGTSAATEPPKSSTVVPPSPDASTEVDAASDAAVPARDGGGEYTYGDWSEWSGCSVTCGEGTKTRTRECKRRDGLPVNCTHCGGGCTETQACSASTCCKPREECCPVMPYNVCGGTMTWCTDTLAQYAASCAAAGCIWTGATTCTIGGSASNATLPGGMGTCQ